MWNMHGLRGSVFYFKHAFHTMRIYYCPEELFGDD